MKNAREVATFCLAFFRRNHVCLATWLILLAAPLRGEAATSRSPLSEPSLLEICGAELTTLFYGLHLRDRLDLKTQRLSLSLMGLQDYDEWINLKLVSHQRGWLNGWQRFIPIAASYFRNHPSRLRNSMEYIFSIRSLGSSEIIGFVQVIREYGHPVADLHISLFPSAHGKGYAQEALKRIMQHFSDKARIRDYQTFIVAENTAPQNLFERLGFTKREAVEIFPEIRIYRWSTESESR